MKRYKDTFDGLQDGWVIIHYTQQLLLSHCQHLVNVKIGVMRNVQLLLSVITSGIVYTPLKCYTVNCLRSRISALMVWQSVRLSVLILVCVFVHVCNMEYVIWNLICNMEYDIEYEEHMNSHIDELSDIDNVDAHIEVIYSIFISHDIT